MADAKIAIDPLKIPTPSFIKTSIAATLLEATVAFFSNLKKIPYIDFLQNSYMSQHIIESFNQGRCSQA